MKIVAIKWSCSLPVLCFVLLTQPMVQADGAETLPHGFEAGWKGQQTCKVLYETATVRVGHCSFAPGIGHEKHYHNPHFGFVLEGSTMLIKDQSGEHEVFTETGSAWSTSNLTVHEAINSGSTTASYLIVEPRPESAPSNDPAE